MDVLEAGAPDTPRPDGPRRGKRIAVALGAAVLAVAIAVGAAQWWTAASARPERLEITALEPVGPFAISGDDVPEGWPRGLVAGALRLRVAISGDPQRTTRADTAGDTGAYAAQGLQDAVIPAGDRAEADVVVTPTDCGTIDSPASPLIDAEGTAIPMAPEAERTLVDALRSLCAPGQPSPDISANSVRVDVFFRDRTLVMRARITTDPPGEGSATSPTKPDRVVLQPRDSVGFRGGSAQEATIEGGAATARLRWLISPAEAAGLEAPTVRVRVFLVAGGRAYPWMLDLRVPGGVSAGMMAEPRNDGVDLAEVAPRPSG